MTGQDTPEALLVNTANDREMAVWREVEAWRVRADIMRAAAESFGGKLPTHDDNIDWGRLLERYRAMEAVVFHGAGLAARQGQQPHPAEERAR